jgi:diadenosine tetraphosphate (Ap4A) HIT family hydrolase
MNASNPGDCPFCQVPEARVIESNSHALAIADAFPVSPGHTLIIPRRHVASFFELTGAEVLAIHELLGDLRLRLDDSLHPPGYNVGINVGTAAGQTVMHAHVHLIPRYRGDVPDPVGGVRNIIQGKGRYT